MWNALVVGLTCLGALCLTACQVERAQLGSPTVAIDIVPSEWALVELDGVAIKSGTNVPTLQLTKDGKAAGFAGCNRYSGSFEIAPDRLTFGQLAATRMFCAEGMDLEQKYLSALERTRGYRQSGTDLQLVGDAGTVARFAKR